MAHLSARDKSATLRRGGGGGEPRGANPVAMQEQSHLDEMRAALRGDRERAEQSRKTLENVLAVSSAATEAVPEPEPAPARRSFLGSLLRRR